MRIEEVPISSVHPDPNQPRKEFDDEYISGLARSIKTEGLINPIEVDENLVIITGECRYRACLLNEMETIQVKINDSEMSALERFRRQLIENLHQSGSRKGTPMNIVDTAMAMRKLLQLSGIQTQRAITPTLRGKEVAFLADQLSMSRGYVWDLLRVSSAPKHVLEQVASTKVDARLARRIVTAPDEIRDKAVTLINTKDLNIDKRKILYSATRKYEQGDTQGALSMLDQDTVKNSNYVNTVLEHNTRVIGLLEKINWQSTLPSDKDQIKRQIAAIVNMIRDLGT